MVQDVWFFAKVDKLMKKVTLASQVNQEFRTLSFKLIVNTHYIEL